MQWPSELTYAQIERITEETTRAGCAFDPIACYEGDGNPMELLGEWAKFAGNTRTSIVVLFWWVNDCEGADEAELKAKLKEFNAILAGDTINEGRIAFEKALDRFSMAAGRNRAFGRVAEKSRLAADQMMETSAREFEKISIDAVLQMAGGDVKSGDSPAESDSTPADTPTGS